MPQGEFYTSIYYRKVKNEITPFDYDLEFVTRERGPLSTSNSKLYATQHLRISKQDVPQLIKELKELLKQ